MKKIFTSVDIGSDTVKFLVSEVYDGNVNVLSAFVIITFSLPVIVLYPGFSIL